MVQTRDGTFHPEFLQPKLTLGRHCTPYKDGVLLSQRGVDAFIMEMYQSIIREHGAGTIRHVVYIMSGGEYVGKRLASLLNAHAWPIYYSKRDKAVPDTPETLDLTPFYGLIGVKERVLLIDDIVDTGETLFDVYASFSIFHSNLVTATLACFIETDKIIIPDIVGTWCPSNIGYLYFPWEVETDHG